MDVRINIVIEQIFSISIIFGIFLKIDISENNLFL